MCALIALIFWSPLNYSWLVKWHLGNETPRFVWEVWCDQKNHCVGKGWGFWFKNYDNNFEPIVSYHNQKLEEAFKGSCFEHSMSKGCQYSNVCCDLHEVSIKLAPS